MACVLALTASTSRAQAPSESAQDAVRALAEAHVKDVSYYVEAEVHSGILEENIRRIELQPEGVVVRVRNEEFGVDFVKVVYRRWIVRDSEHVLRFERFLFGTPDMRNREVRELWGPEYEVPRHGVGDIYPTAASIDRFPDDFNADRARIRSGEWTHRLEWVKQSYITLARHTARTLAEASDLKITRDGDLRVVSSEIEGFTAWIDRSGAMAKVRVRLDRGGIIRLEYPGVLAEGVFPARFPAREVKWIEKGPAEYGPYPVVAEIANYSGFRLATAEERKSVEPSRYERYLSGRLPPPPPETLARRAGRVLNAAGSSAATYPGPWLLGLTAVLAIGYAFKRLVFRR